MGGRGNEKILTSDWDVGPLALKAKSRPLRIHVHIMVYVCMWSLYISFLSISPSYKYQSDKIICFLHSACKRKVFPLKSSIGLDGFFFTFN